MKLILSERLRLLELLPTEGNRMNLKIVRKLRESLSFSEVEMKLIPAQYEFACTQLETDKEGTTTSCGAIGYFSGNEARCDKHGEPMVATGNWRILDATPLLASENEKDIHFGDEALKIAETPLMTLDSTGKLKEEYVTLYDKFFPPREDEDAIPSEG